MFPTAPGFGLTPVMQLQINGCFPLHLHFPKLLQAFFAPVRRGSVGNASLGEWKTNKAQKYHFALQCSTSEETNFCEPLVLLKYSMCCNDKCTALMFPAPLARDIVNQCFAFSYSISVKLGVTLV